MGENMPFKGLKDEADGGETGAWNGTSDGKGRDGGAWVTGGGVGDSGDGDGGLSWWTAETEGISSKTCRRPASTPLPAPGTTGGSNGAVKLWSTGSSGRGGGSGGDDGDVMS